MIVAGFLLLLSGAVLAFLMVMDLLAKSFLLVFLSYGCTVIGLALGFTGIVQYMHSRR